MILDEIATYIAANSTFVVGTDLFKTRIPPESTGDLIGLYEPPGAEPMYRLSNTVDHERPSLQVIARAGTYTTARTNAQTVWDLLSSVANSTLGSTGNPTYVSITPRQSPHDIGSDTLDRYLVSCNFTVSKTVT